MEKNTLYAHFKYEKSDEELVNELDRYLTEKAQKIFDFFDTNLKKESLEIRIIPTKKEYDELNMKRRGINEIPKWSIGTYYDNIIEYVSLNDYQNTSHSFPKEKYPEAIEYYKKTIIHEYTHYVLDLYLKKHHKDSPLKYLNEGIAQYLSGQRDNIKIDFNYSLDDILNSNNSYLAWYLITKYIIEKYGREYFLKLIINNNLAQKETKKLYEEAKKYYQENYRKTE